MLDSAFSSDIILAETGMPVNESGYIDIEDRHGRNTGSVDLLRPMLATNVYTSSKSSIWEDGVSQKYTLQQIQKAPGIKERAWDGIISTDGRMRLVHNP